MKTRTRSLFTLLAPLALLGATGLHATVTAVNWGGNYVSATQNLQGDTTIHAGSDAYGDPYTQTGVDIINGTGDAYDNDALLDDSVRGRFYSSVTAFNPGSPGYNTAATSAIFYGGATTFSKNDTHVDGFTELDVLNQGSNDSIHFHTDSGTDDHTMHALLFWKKENFLNGANLQSNLSFDTLSNFSLTTGQVSNGNAGSQDMMLRWAVQSGGTWHLSSSANILTPNNTFTDNVFATTWAIYDPTANNMNFHQDAASFTIASSALNDITALGFYLDHDRATGQPHMHVEHFSSSVVPEPGRAMLLCFGLGSLLLRRRRIKG